MNIIKPKALPYDTLEWQEKPYAEQLKMVCRAWALEGYGSPLMVYLFYALKIVGYIAGWAWFCSFTPGLGSFTDWSWALTPIAFQKAIAFSMLFEVVGLGCGSGPLTARFVPPFGAITYWLRPGTTKSPMSFIEGLPLLGGPKRNILDVALYGALLTFLVLALIEPTPLFEHWLPIIVLLPIIGILDRTIFLAARAEHYWVTIVIIAFATNWIAGAMWVQLALWFFAGFSKLNHHFPTVVAVMTSNGPFTPFAWYRKSMYKNYPEDLNPSTSAVVHARMGTILELGVGIVLATGALSGSTTILATGLIMLFVLHAYILSNVPMGVPLEWNVLVVYGGIFFFYTNSALGGTHINPLEVGPWYIAAFIAIWSYLIPLYGNIRPAAVSFLLAMRYYAGNWPCSVWLIKKDSVEKLKKLKMSAPIIPEQLSMLYDKQTAVGVVSRVIAFRLMHLHGRGIKGLISKAIDVKDFSQYQWFDGEVVAGMALGWNFGDGHLHHENLMRAIQKQCEFEEGEVRCVFVEGQSLIDNNLPYRIADAKSGEIERGNLDIKQLRNEQGWPVA